MKNKKELAAAMVEELQKILKNVHDLEHKVKTLLRIAHCEKYDDDDDR